MSAVRRVPAINLGATATNMRFLKKKRARRQLGEVFTARKPLSEEILQVKKAVVLQQKPGWGRQQILL